MEAALSPQYLMPTQSLDAYVRSIRAYPMLSEAEEFELVQQLHEHGDIEAAKKLVVSHLRFVIHVAKGYAGYGLPLLDLIQEGNIGLMKAVRRFDPKVGVRLISFAVHWIKSEIHEFIIRNWRIVKIATTKAQRKLFYNLRSGKKRLGWMNTQEIENVAADLNVSAKSVREMESRLAARDASFESATDGDDEDSPFIPSQYLEDENSNPETAIVEADTKYRLLKQMQAALSELDERSQDIIRSRWLQEKKITLQQLATKYAISTERIRQLEKNTLRKIRQAIPA